MSDVQKTKLGDAIFGSMGSLFLAAAVARKPYIQKSEVGKF